MRFFKKKNLLKFERNGSRLLSSGGAKEQSLREEREKFVNDATRENQSFFFLKEFCRGEDEQKRRSFRGGRKKRAPKRCCIRT